MQRRAEPAILSTAIAPPSCRAKRQKQGLNSSICYHKSMQKLSGEDIEARLGELKGWSVENSTLTKDFGFKGFSTAIEFMNRLVPYAEKLDHHPDWSNSYNRVIVNLTSHDVRGLTKNDFLFAEAADKVAAQLQK